MFLLNPKVPSRHCRDAASRELIEKTIGFFEAKGKARLRKDDLDRTWYADFLEFAGRERLFATFLTPSSLGGAGAAGIPGGTAPSTRSSGSTGSPTGTPGRSPSSASDPSG